MNRAFKNRLTKSQLAALGAEARKAWSALDLDAETAQASAAEDPFGLPASASSRFDAWRRDEVESCCGVRSFGDVGQNQYRKLLQHFQSLAKREWPTGEAPANLWDSERGPQLRKVGKLLGSAGRSWEYGHGLARRIAKVERLDWCDTYTLRKIIGELVKDARRHGRRE